MFCLCLFFPLFFLAEDEQQHYKRRNLEHCSQLLSFHAQMMNSIQCIEESCVSSKKGLYWLPLEDTQAASAAAA